MQLVDYLAKRISDHASSRNRTLVAIDGPDAAGKTMLADRLAPALSIPVVRASVDSFENPTAVRIRRGQLSGEAYYRDGFDHASFRRRLLEPFAAGESPVLTRLRDGFTDELDEQYADVPATAVLLADGVFLQRPELRELWSFVVYLRVSPEVSLDRARSRDLAWTDTVERIELGYLRRYLPGQELYRADVDPESLADVVIDNSDPANPIVVR